MFGLDTYPDAVLRGVILSLIALFWVAVLVRIVGLRTLSKMTAIDFVVTLATGSLLATMISVSNWHAFVQAGIGVAMLTGWQYLYAKARRSPAVRHGAENQPKLLVRNGRFLDVALAETRVTRDDVFAKLRENNVADLSTVDAVVLEVTGDIAVLTGAGGASAHMLHDVRDA